MLDRCAKPDMSSTTMLYKLHLQAAVWWIQLLQHHYSVSSLPTHLPQARNYCYLIHTHIRTGMGLLQAEKKRITEIFNSVCLFIFVEKKNKMDQTVFAVNALFVYFYLACITFGILPSTIPLWMLSVNQPQGALEAELFTIWKTVSVFYNALHQMEPLLFIK